MTTFINDSIVVLDGVDNVVKGIVRGQGMKTIHYFYNNEKELGDFVLDDWLYIKRSSTNKDLALLTQAVYEQMDETAKDYFTSNIVNTINFNAAIGDAAQDASGKSIALNLIDAYKFSVDLGRKKEHKKRPFLQRAS